jgi:hypothetical protein
MNITLPPARNAGLLAASPVLLLSAFFLCIFTPVLMTKIMSFFPDLGETERNSGSRVWCRWMGFGNACCS